MMICPAVTPPWHMAGFMTRVLTEEEYIDIICSAITGTPNITAATSSLLHARRSSELPCS
jgi:hypothetical protein